MQTSLPTVFRSLAFGLEATVAMHDDRSRRCVVSLRGELDAVSAPPMRRMLRDLADAGHAFVDLDMRELTFIDSAGVLTLQHAARAAESRGGRLTMWHPAGQVDRLLAIVGLHASRGEVINED
jgi:anti-sigma B factor antagonist